MSTPLKVCVLQINPLVGDVLHNFSKIRRAIEEDPSRADLYVTPELALVGYSPRDLLSVPRLIEAEADALQQLSALSEQHKIGILVGHTERHAGNGKPLLNAATLFDSGLCIGRIRKRRIPYYDIFEENRFFESYLGEDQEPLSFRGAKLGIFICEDAWTEVRRYGKYDAGFTPHAELIDKQLEGSDLLINLSASPFAVGKKERRHVAFGAHAVKHKAPLIFASCVGAQDCVLFDGGTFAMNAEGAVIAESKLFEENELLLEFKSDSKTLRALEGTSADQASSWEKIEAALVMGIRDYVRKSGFKRAVIGLSGGIDSGLVAALACKALGPQNVLGVSLPSRFNSEETRSDARTLAANLGMEFREVPITPLLSAVTDELRVDPKGLTYENLQSRCRGIMLMTISAQESRLLLATGNKSEFAMGYATLYGDMCGALAPIGDLYKTEVFGLCHSMQSKGEVFPLSMLLRAPSAELAPDQKDQDSLPDYAVLDTVLEDLIENQNLRAEAMEHLLSSTSEHSMEHVAKVFYAMEYKRFQAAPILKIHSRGFDTGWKMPLAKGVLR